MKRVVSFTINTLSSHKSIWGSSIKAHCSKPTKSNWILWSKQVLFYWPRLFPTWFAAGLYYSKMFTSDLVLSKIKIPSQKLGKRKESSKQLLLCHRFQFYISFFRSYFLNLWLLTLGRKHMTWFRGHTRNSTRDWIQPVGLKYFGATTWTLRGQEKR